jgi:hypothetical protein
MVVHQYRIFKDSSKSVSLIAGKTPVNETQSLKWDLEICLSLIYFEQLLLQEIRRVVILLARTKVSSNQAEHSEQIKLVFRNIRETLKLQLQYRRDEILEQTEVKTGLDRSQILLKVFPASEKIIRKNLQKIVAAILDFYKITFTLAHRMVRRGRNPLSMLARAADAVDADAAAKKAPKKRKRKTSEYQLLKF